MTYLVTFLSNDRAQLIISEHRTNDEEILAVIVENGEERGYKVIVRSEG